MLDGKEYFAVELILLTTCGFIDRMIESSRSPKLTRKHVFRNRLMSSATSSNWSRQWTGYYLKEPGKEECEISNQIAVLFSFGSN